MILTREQYLGLKNCKVGDDCKDCIATDEFCRCNYSEWVEETLESTWAELEEAKEQIINKDKAIKVLYGTLCRRGHGIAKV
jgi:hypothetical protein